ncbi:hypothetical protein G7K_5480-t1 [Saitoella complicata NRRL Y-17804]|uniref:Uncharacterized protein n=1 Tax=Saitoella complicata (strain BCRC 22490 / CBS 7301 / JCM 7358 / NBRC 10748 / NRRL Y-17804) TaxID=698492 RepID=A0A0E9NNK4_SAICN|nr:hypothetical protein G7K_5480-t1 [Saitoella complicata NRRL Y-17804]
MPEYGIRLLLSRRTTLVWRMMAHAPVGIEMALWLLEFEVTNDDIECIFVSFYPLQLQFTIVGIVVSHRIRHSDVFQHLPNLLALLLQGRDFLRQGVNLLVQSTDLALQA